MEILNWGIFNWIRGMLCTNNNGHVASKRYSGMSVDGYECEICKYRWYVKK